MILSESNTTSIPELETLANSIRVERHSLKCCKEVSEQVATCSDLLIYDNFILILNDTEETSVNGHVVNITKDFKTIYDFTGDQYTRGASKFKVWIYQQVKPKVYCSRYRKPSKLPDWCDGTAPDLYKLSNNNEGYRIIFK